MSEWFVDKQDQYDNNREIEKIGVLQLSKKPLYHYTSREVFWKIIESETLLARHIRFSNDMEEQELGINLMKNAMKKENMEMDETMSNPFMVCFCEKDDLLSQWRGYANEGIALEFDFMSGLGVDGVVSPYYCFTVLNNDTFSRETSQSFVNQYRVWKDGRIEEKECYMGIIATPYHVIYVNKGKKGREKINECMRKIQDTVREDKTIFNQQMIGLIPYIKNDKFEEESEYRLIFDLSKQLQISSWHILEDKYIYLDAEGVKKPNIRVKFGDQLETENQTKIDIYYNKNEENIAQILYDFSDELNDLIWEKDKEKQPVSIEVKNTNHINANAILISSGKYQKDICGMLRQRFRQKSYVDGEIKIWCDGHLPIRRIIVGPSKDADYMVRSIKEYIKTKYWMHDIKIEISKIPLRT